MDTGERYLQLARLGREAFVEAAAPAALVRRKPGGGSGGDLPFDPETTTLVSSDDPWHSHALRRHVEGDLEVYPLVKKPGASFADMITVGRTANNDVVLNDVTVSRFHAFFRQRGEGWIVCDAGSKNGTRLDSRPLEPRKERPLVSGALVHIGDIETLFLTADALFDALARSLGDP